MDSNYSYATTETLIENGTLEALGSNPHRVVIWWPDVCGNRTYDDAFWDDDVSINTRTPDFTECFQKTVFAWIPCIYMFFVVILYVPHLVSIRTVNRWRHTSKLNLAKMNMCVVLVCLSLLKLISCLVDQNTGVSRPASDVVESGSYISIYIIAAFLTHYEYRKGKHSGGVLFILWSYLSIVLAITFRSLILHIRYDEKGVPHLEDAISFVVFFMTYALVFAQFICAWVPDLQALPWHRKQAYKERIPLIIEPDKEPEIDPFTHLCPAATAPFWSRMLFLWMTGLIIKGYKQTLQFGDLWSLMSNDKASRIVPGCMKYWAQEVKKHNFQMVNRESHESRMIRFRDISLSGKTKLSHVTDNVFKNAINPPRAADPAFEGMPRTQFRADNLPSLWTVLVKAFGFKYSAAGFFFLVTTLLTFLNPAILNAIITFISVPNAYVWQGYTLVFGLFISNCVKTVFNQWFWHLCYVTGLRVRTAVVAMIYRKALKLNNSARKSSTVGEIVNLMTVDAQKLQSAAQFLHLIWASPLTVGLALYFLWQQLGVSVLAGFALMLLLVPLNAMIAQKTRTLQIMQMRWKDQRIKLMNEILNGIKVLKLYAWEKSFEDRVRTIREKEVRVLRTSQFLLAVSSISWYMAPYFVSIGSFAVYVLSDENHVLDANRTFVSLSLFNIMNYPLSMLPAAISYCVQASVAVARINRFLRNDELNPENVKKPAFTTKQSVHVESASFTWNNDEEPALHDINININEGKLVMIVGQVGAGKSSLLSAILGEMEKIKGKVFVKGSCAYVPQQAWIQNDTLQKNILFSKEYMRNKYNKVIEACALGPDIELLPGGDKIEIGENGLNLSGGQRQRISLARAIYQNSDVYLLDDPLSAVDVHLAKHIFENALGPEGMLKHKTRLLVSHSMTFLPKADMIIVLKNGMIAEMGTYEELTNHDGELAEYLASFFREHIMDTESDDSQDTQIKFEMMQKISRVCHTDLLSLKGEEILDDGSVFSGQQSHFSRRSERIKSRLKRKRHASRRTMSGFSEKDIMEAEDKRCREKKLTNEEKALTGALTFNVFKAWLGACGHAPVVLSLLFYILYIAAQICTNIWLSVWSRDVPRPNNTQQTNQEGIRLGVYGGLGAVQGEAITAVGIWKLFGSQAENWYFGLFPLAAFAIGTLGQAMSLAVACVSASRTLHKKLLTNILKAPMLFFDTTPVGRILNRFSTDIDSVDVNIPLTLRVWMFTFASCITTVFVISYSTPIFLLFMAPLSVVYYFIQRFYIATSRQLKRIDSIRRSPIYSHFGETLIGAESIRAYKQQSRYIEKNDQLLDENQMAYYPNILCMRWLGTSLDGLGNLIVLIAGLIAIIQRDSINASLAGLSFTYALQITGLLSVCVRMTSDLEAYIVSIERIQEYMDCPKEAPAIVPGNRPNPAWPNQGRVQFKGYSTRYRRGLDLVLKDINVNIEPGEKIGVVGRTGAGKTSLSLAMFRIIEPTSGQILIDGTSISYIGVHDLRSRVTIIPQEPVLFTGSLRLNLDPFDQHTEDELLHVLRHAHLINFVSLLPGGLEYGITEGGDNLSVGQRQLVCLARALLRRSKILILDEATAGIDMETDDLIQETIREELHDATVITIAHRLNSVMDYDKILVLERGAVVEIAPPAQLLENRSSAFYGMAYEAGIIQ